MAARFSVEDVSSHNKADNLWIVVDEDVYDLTQFQDDHPGELFFLGGTLSMRIPTRSIDRYSSNSPNRR